MDREEEIEGMHEVRRDPEQRLPLAHRLEHQSEMALLEIADAAVDEPAGAGARAEGEVPLLDEGGAQPAHGGVAGDSRSGDPAADHQQIDVLGRQALERRTP